MGEGQGATGLSRDATVSLFRPARNSILLLLGLITGMAIWFGVTAGPALGFGFALKLAAMLGAAAIVSFSQFRDFLFALCVVIGALPGAALVFGGASLMGTPVPLGVLVAFVFVLGFAVALIAAERFVLRVIEIEDPKQAAIMLLREDGVFPLSILIVSAGMPAVAAIAIPGRVLPDCFLLAGVNAAGVLSAWIAVPLLGSLMHAGEDFISGTNRIREAWTRRLDPVTEVVRPPWAWSATGILVVLFVLVFFGSASATIAAGARVGPALAGAAAAIVLGSAFAARDARRTVALSIAAAGSLGLAVWGFARVGALLDGTLMRLTAELLAICFVPISATAAAAARSTREYATAASQAGVLTAGPSALVGTLAALALLAPWFREGGRADVGAILALAFAACGALVFQPALAGALEAFLPRRKTIAERYRVK